MKHLRSHVGENTYVCEIDNCKQSFRLQSELRDHYSTHYQPNESQIENIVSDSQENQKVFLIKTENVTEITTNSKEHSEIAWKILSLINLIQFFKSKFLSFISSKNMSTYRSSPFKFFKWASNKKILSVILISGFQSAQYHSVFLNLKIWRGLTKLPA